MWEGVWADSEEQRSQPEGSTLPSSRGCGVDLTQKLGLRAAAPAGLDRLRPLRLHPLPLGMAATERWLGDSLWPGTLVGHSAPSAVPLLALSGPCAWHLCPGRPRVQTGWWSRRDTDLQGL